MDRGEGRLSLPAELAAALRASMLPSLLAAWHSRLAELMRTPAAPEQESRPRAAAASKQVESVGRSAPESSVSQAGLARPAPHGVESTADLSGRESGREGAVASNRDQGLQAARPGLAQDDARAAAHFAEAGQAKSAAESYLAAARRLSDEGDWRRARLMVEQALPLLAGIASRSVRAELSARAHLTMARIQWQGSGRTEGSGLQDALKSLDAAEAALPGEATAGLVGELATIRAGVCYDLGDRASLQAALTALGNASQALLDAGETLEAARLLNDQAAIHLRLDDPAQAVSLLERSEELFERLRQRRADEPVAVEELAETYHLMARVPLHARMQPGSERYALERALTHAQMAERILSKRSNPRRLGRLWETMARLQLAQGNLEAAAERLSQATRLQQRLGDAIGLARSTAAQADLLVRAERPEEAVSALANSVALNYQKGSPMGLAFNRSALTQLRASLEPGAAALQQAVAELEERLTAAERVVGRTRSPVG